MAGCFGNSAEDRYFERQLDDYLDSLVSVEDICGEAAAKEIEELYKEDGGEYEEWIYEKGYMPEEAVEKDTENAILALVRADKNVKDAFYDDVFHDKCMKIYERDHPEEPDYDEDDFRFRD